MSGTTARASYLATTSRRNGTYPGSSMRGGTTATSAAYRAGASGLGSTAIVVACSENALTMS